LIVVLWSARVQEAEGSEFGIARVLEGVYTRNLSLSGALVSLPGRFLNRFNDL
jgi:hypothetical protein